LANPPGAFRDLLKLVDSSITKERYFKMKSTVLYISVILLLSVVAVTACIQPASMAGSAAPVEAEAHQHHGTPPSEAEVSPLLGCLGNHQHPITTEVELAQAYFNEGLILALGFNHEEAIRSFRGFLKLCGLPPLSNSVNLSLLASPDPTSHSGLLIETLLDPRRLKLGKQYFARL
jgi:hypothetical protein